MTLTGLHFLLTYRCLYECDHCFVWGSPRQPGTMTTKDVERVLLQARELGTLEWIYFEGGEPFLFYASLLDCVKRAAALGFKVGLVSNAYWATDVDDALRCLRPFENLVQDLSISSDLYHGDEPLGANARHAVEAARELGIPASTIHVAPPGDADAEGFEVRFRGRAAEKLAGQVEQHPWPGFDCCPHEELREPRRVHLDPLGHLHVCQGITIGNVLEQSLKEICESYDPEAHPVVGPLLRGGPAALVTDHDLPHAERYADACQLCYAARSELRRRQPATLVPDQMYGIAAED